MQEIAKLLQEEFDKARQEQEVVVPKVDQVILVIGGGYKLSHFKGMSYEDIRPIFERVWDQNNAFVPKDSEIEKEVMKRPGFDFQQKSSKKRSREDSDEDNAKKQKLEDDAKKKKLRDSMDVVLRDDIAIDVEADGSLKNYKVFSEMLDDFDRQDVMDLYRLVQESTGVDIHMMIEKKYPITQEMLSRMLSRRLEVDHESEMAYELLSDENSSIDDLTLDNEFDRLCKMSLKIIPKNKQLKSNRNSLENKLSKLKSKLTTLKKNKGVDHECTNCQLLKIDNEKLKEEALKPTKFEKRTHSLNEMLSNQKPSDDNNQKPSGVKLGLGFNSFEASSSGTKEIKFVKAQKKTSSDGGPINMGGPQIDQEAPKIIMGPPPSMPGSEKIVSFQKSILGPRPKHIIVNKVKILVASDSEVKQFYKPLSKPGVGFSKPNFRSKSPPPKRVNNNYSRPKKSQPKRHVGRQNQPHGILICLGVDLEPNEWIKDSGCSKHMMGNRKLFSTYKAYNGGNVIFGSNLRGNIIGKGTISNDSLKIDNVEHVDNLGFNLLSIGQICDNKCKVTFSEHDSEITKDGKVIGRGIRKKGLYVMKLGNKPKDQICLATIDENSTLWHRRLGHANMRLIQSLASKELVRNLPKLKFDQHFCDACKIGKQAHASHKAKNIVSTTRCLELHHVELFGPSVVRSYGGNRYTLVIVDDYSRWYDCSCMHRGAYNLGVATPRALVHAGDKTSEDARSWNGYLRKRRKTKPKRQNRTRNGKAGKDKVKVQAQA
ncbi:retrovirus-related pol polyprotein from transposon TNT 1-94 [Tanacetum coccineum]